MEVCEILLFFFNRDQETLWRLNIGRKKEMKMDSERKKRVMQVLHVAESSGEYGTPLLMGSSWLLECPFS